MARSILYLYHSTSLLQLSTCIIHSRESCDNTMAVRNISTTRWIIYNTVLDILQSQH